jgi:hypothetical protein
MFRREALSQTISMSSEISFRSKIPPYSAQTKDLTLNKMEYQLSQPLWMGAVVNEMTTACLNMFSTYSLSVLARARGSVANKLSDLNLRAALYFACKSLKMTI